jgi:hypothetical protein
MMDAFSQVLEASQGEGDGGPVPSSSGALGDAFPPQRPYNIDVMGFPPLTSADPGVAGILQGNHFDPSQMPSQDDY